MGSAVYIVDDHEEVRQAIAFLLQTCGRETLCFAGGQAFLDRVEDLAPGVILLDVRMPELDGLAVLAELGRRHIAWPVVVMSGHGEAGVVVDAITRGAIDFLEKPFEESLLLACIDQASRLPGCELALSDARRRAPPPDAPAAGARRRRSASSPSRPGSWRRP